MNKSIIRRINILGARVISRLTGQVPKVVTWNTIWGSSRKFASDRWVQRQKEFEHREFDYDDALDFLNRSNRSGNREVRASSKDFMQGSIPEAELAVIASHLNGLVADRALKGLHIGNFVGLSLAYLTDAARKLHPESVIVSVDPNVPHRGVDNPQDMVLGLMTRYGLESSWLPIAGFTLKRGELTELQNHKKSTTAFSSYYGFAPEYVLHNLEKLGVQFDFALIDGNHDAEYLNREIQFLSKLVRPGGFLFLDDVDEEWDGVIELFDNLDGSRFCKVAHVGRIGVVQIV